MMPRIASALVWLLACMGTSSALNAEVRWKDPITSETSLGASRIVIVQPQQPNGRLLLFNRGVTPQGEPVSATIPSDRDPFRTLLEEGWTLAATSYRRSGIVIRDAMSDVLALRTHVAEEFGLTAPPVLVGAGMGGAISVRLIEQHPDVFAGALILGRGLLLQDPGYPGEPTFQPMRPTVLLVNRNEMTDSRTYAEVASADYGILVPLFTVARPGHLNFEPAEELSALRALLAWIDAGVAPPAWFDVTGEAPRLPSSARFADGGAHVRVASVDPANGNLVLSLILDDLARLSLSQGDTVLIRIGERMILARWVATADRVPSGGWALLSSPDGRMILTRRDEDASRSLAIRTGSEIWVGRAGMD